MAKGFGVTKNNEVVLTSRDKERIAYIERREGKSITELLRRDPAESLQSFILWLGISLNEKKKWSKYFLGTPSAFKTNCPRCGEVFYPTNAQNTPCGSCKAEINTLHCENCGDEFDPVPNPYEREYWEKQGYCSEECIREFQHKRKEEGRRKFLALLRIDRSVTYSYVAEVEVTRWVYIRKLVLERDGHTCRNLSCTYIGKLDVHHNFWRVPAWVHPKKWWLIQSHKGTPAYARGYGRAGTGTIVVEHSSLRGRQKSQ